MRFRIVNFRPERISGWVYAPEGPDSRILDILVDGDFAASVTANIFRGELPASEFATRNIGFVAALPPEYWTGEPRQVLLQHRQSGAILGEQTLEAPDARVPGAPEVTGQATITAQGHVGGWVSREGARTIVRLLVDGKEICSEPANSRRLSWSKDHISMDIPPEYGFSFQVPPDYFDDAEHQIQLLTAAKRQDVVLAERSIILSSALRDQAAQEAERLTTAPSDKRHLWEQIPRTQTAATVESLSVSSTYVTLTLSGNPHHSRALFRYGQSTVILRPLAPRQEKSADGTGPGSRSYAAALAPPKLLSGAYELFTGGTTMQGSYDLRLGDESGPRPASLPLRIVEDVTERLGPMIEQLRTEQQQLQRQVQQLQEQNQQLLAGLEGIRSYLVQQQLRQAFSDLPGVEISDD